MEEIRQSLHYGTYLDHAKSIKLAADENNRQFYKIVNKLVTEDDDLRALGLLRSTLLLYAVCIELLLKSIGLFKEKENIKSGEIKSFNDFLKKWTKNKLSKGHDFNKIIEFYKIPFPVNDLNLIIELQNYAIWGGRFPFPKSEDETLRLENISGAIGSPISLSYIDRIKKIIEDIERSFDR